MSTTTPKKRAALVVLSGGQDSTTCLWWARNYYEHVHAITFNYGQRHDREIQAARQVAALAGVETHEVINLPAGILASTSPLVSTQALEQYSSFADMEQIIGDRVEKTFVPMRNSLFLTIAANRAVALGVNEIVTGVCQEDNANYPDCREAFIFAQESAIHEALGVMDITICTPLMNLSKAKSIELMHRLGGFHALAFTHTAYDGQYPPIGKDHATVLRAHGFEEAMAPDPLVFRAFSEDLMALPDSPNYTEFPTTAYRALNDQILNSKVALREKGLL